ncbi:DNA methyltransferase [Janibacter melonis]|uniref:site-specific DNA-methyltransferase (adenine-specific) n=1 Tax=Janibacter melonis TaxID=262209 RepID=A0A176QDH4_9MICO|nr:Eco57I restriction-modification methylase domain-containing protein [Janibacter melonis]OAB87817.1 DNA methyltransferase [Janibacter melonis]
MPETDWTNYGEVFTRRWVVDTILDAVGYSPDADLSSVRLCEPSCGSGAFLGPIVERLIASAKRHDVPLDALGDAIRAYDLQPEHVEVSRRMCADLLLAVGCDAEAARAQAEQWVNVADFLLDLLDPESFDVVVGNPPYIRYDDLPTDVATAYRLGWQTMRGRGDIYVGFFERSLLMLKPGGRVGFICADRWMRNQYGAPLRAFVSEGFAVEQVWTMHDVDAFEAQVSAYPAITVMSRKPQGSVVVADTTAAFGAPSARTLLRWTQDEEEAGDFSGEGFAAHRLPHWFEGTELWPTGSPARLALIELLTDNFEPLHDPNTNTKVSIGVATGADKVYVTKDADAVEADRMLPLAMRRDLMGGEFEWQGNYLVNPWDAEGRLVDLADYPRMAAYLNEHPGLKDRHVAKKAPASWHRTIDKVTPGLTEKPKLLLQDMKAHIHPVLERGGHYPHHNLYYVTSDTWDMEVLGGLLLSRIAQAFIEAYCVRMRGGTLRFQSQYLKKIRVPNPATLDAQVADDLRDAFRQRDVSAATLAAAQAYSIDPVHFELLETPIAAT